jgi:hypothetical protein
MHPEMNEVGMGHGGIIPHTRNRVMKNKRGIR